MMLTEQTRQARKGVNNIFRWAESKEGTQGIYFLISLKDKQKVQIQEKNLKGEVQNFYFIFFYAGPLFQ